MTETNLGLTFHFLFLLGLVQANFASSKLPRINQVPLSHILHTPTSCFQVHAHSQKYGWKKNLDQLDSIQVEIQGNWNIPDIPMSWRILGRKGCIHYLSFHTNMCPLCHLNLSNLESYLYFLNSTSRTKYYAKFFVSIFVINSIQQWLYAVISHCFPVNPLFPHNEFF